MVSMEIILQKLGKEAKGKQLNLLHDSVIQYQAFNQQTQTLHKGKLQMHIDIDGQKCSVVVRKG